MIYFSMYLTLSLAVIIINDWGVADAHNDWYVYFIS